MTASPVTVPARNHPHETISKLRTTLEMIVTLTTRPARADLNTLAGQLRSNKPCDKINATRRSKGT